MSKPKKFGTFAGVYTPSVLTILGVIMYMRMGWVVGNAGLIGTIIIILIAHIISVSTGLSISSIATDKKIGAGGVYYVLSRSLGLPIGGAIGLTLFVGTALSIALYLIGFSESFNAYFELGTTLNDFRLTASIALISLATIALISTSVALKTQFFIMLAIGASLISIFFGSMEFAPTTIPFFGDENGASMEEVFAIFFPAVTGFTAGIAMSGDLNNPKKSIPAGTIWSIVTGLVVYIGLAIFLAYAINKDVLVSDNNILMKIAMFAPAVVAGIWGATLSSALGGILGGPRILQAMSLDKITPKFFGKGVGKENEPRNALILTVLIAQCGILIGELDLIARIVSMFYLAAYGFINLSFVLESWASTDFSPTFKVKKWIGTVGFIATFAVMFKLDMLAMIASFIIIGGVYLYLTKKQISLGSGDIWSNVWSSIVRKGLKKMDQQTSVDPKNWRPNILLFSGGTDSRPHLIEFSKSLAGKVGMVSNFDLIENKDATVLFPKHKQSVQDDFLQESGIFARRQEVQNVFKGIEIIASTYGFSGVEPNTVLMGWAKNTNDPIWFGQMTKKLIDLDYNVFYLDYDQSRGFGKYKRIDIWWRSISNNSELTLKVIKFLHASPEWHEAEVNIFLINNTLQEGFEKKINTIINEYRINANVKVINNSIDQKPFYEIVSHVSSDADLILAGIPEIIEGKEKEFIDNTNKILNIIGTTLLVKSSSKIGSDENISESKNLIEEIRERKAVPSSSLYVDVVIPKKEELAAFSSELHTKLISNSKNLINTYLINFRNNRNSLVNAIAHEFIDKLTDLIDNNQSEDVKTYQLSILEKINTLQENYISEDINYLHERLEDFEKSYIKFSEELLTQIPETLTYKLEKQEILENENDTKAVKKIKSRKRFAKKLGFKPKVTIELKNIVTWHMEMSYLKNFISFQEKLSLTGATLSSEIKNVFFESIQLLELKNKEQAKAEILQKLENLKDLVDDQYHFLADYIEQSAAYTTKKIIDDIVRLDINLITEERKNRKETSSEIKENILAYHEKWVVAETSFFNLITLDAKLIYFNYTLRSQLKFLKDEMNKNLFSPFKKSTKDLNKRLDELEELVNKSSKEQLIGTSLEVDASYFYDNITINQFFTDLRLLTDQLPQNFTILNSETRNDIAHLAYNELEQLNINVSRIVSYLFEKELIIPLETDLPTIPLSIQQVASRINDYLRLINFTISDQLEEGKINKKYILEAIQNAKAKINELIEANHLKEKSTLEKLDSIFQNSISHLNAAYIVDEADILEQSISKDDRTKGIKQVSSKITNAVKKVVTTVKEKIVLKKEDILFAEFQKRNKGNENIHQKILSFVETVKPRKSVLKQVPFYYQQLFNSKHGSNVSFMRNRERELEMAEKAFNRINAGFKGGILVLGEPLSGKSFFSEIIAKQFSSKSKIYKIEPPVTGSININDFQRVLKKQLGSDKPIDSTLKSLKKSSVIIFNDIELWWERSKNGNLIIKEIINLITTYSKDLTFIINCNIHAFQLIKQQNQFHTVFISTISLSPSSINSIRDSILTRHQTVGYEFSLNGVNENELKQSVSNQLFAKYVTISDGNIGYALIQWINNIEQVNNDKTFNIKVPSSNDLPIITKNDWLVLLAQLVIHKHLTVNRIARIFKTKDLSKVTILLQNLIRCGLVEEFMGNTYRISPYVYVPLKRQLKNLQLI